MIFHCVVFSDSLDIQRIGCYVCRSTLSLSVQRNREMKNPSVAADIHTFNFSSMLVCCGLCLLTLCKQLSTNRDILHDILQLCDGLRHIAVRVGGVYLCAARVLKHKFTEQFLLHRMPICFAYAIFNFSAKMEPYERARVKKCMKKALIGSTNKDRKKGIRNIDK